MRKLKKQWCIWPKKKNKGKRSCKTRWLTKNECSKRSVMQRRRNIIQRNSSIIRITNMWPKLIWLKTWLNISKLKPKIKRWGVIWKRRIGQRNKCMKNLPEKKINALNTNRMWLNGAWGAVTDSSVEEYSDAITGCF